MDCPPDPGALGDAASAADDSFQSQSSITPAIPVPPNSADSKFAVLRSGDHQAIAAWRAEQRALRTKQRRPDLLNRLPHNLSRHDAAL